MWQKVPFHKANKLLPCVRSAASTLLRARVISASARNQPVKEEKVTVDGININYANAGSGRHPVLLLPGALGTIWTDFRPQVENLDGNEFTIIAWDPPGYGKSRPCDRTFSDGFLHRDAKFARNLMLKLGHQQFSVIGWSDGGITSLILAATYPENMKKLISVAGNSYIMPEEIEIYEKYRNVDNWSEKMRAPMEEIYGKDGFKKLWSEWVDGMVGIYKKHNGNLCKELLPKIKCPTLIIQGGKDPMVLPEHPVYLNKHIAGSELKIFEKGAHNLHLRYPEEFNQTVTKFLLGKSSL